MTTLYEIVRNLLVIIIIASFLELIMPDGRLRPFVRFSVGLFILIAILNPALDLLFADRSFALGFWDYQLDAGIERSVRDKGEEISNMIYQPQQDVIQSKLQGQINALSILVPGVNDVQSKVQTNPDGSVKKITLQIDTDSIPNRRSGRRYVFSVQRNKLIPQRGKRPSDKIIKMIVIFMKYRRNS
jgi:stage III sporulation protein AF